MHRPKGLCRLTLACRYSKGGAVAHVLQQAGTLAPSTLSTDGAAAVPAWFLQAKFKDTFHFRKPRFIDQNVGISVEHRFLSEILCWS